MASQQLPGSDKEYAYSDDSGSDNESTYSTVGRASLNDETSVKLHVRHPGLGSRDKEKLCKHIQRLGFGGNIKSIIIILDNETRQPKGYAIVSLTPATIADEAIKALDGSLLDEFKLVVQRCKKRQRRRGRGRGKGNQTDTSQAHSRASIDHTTQVIDSKSRGRKRSQPKGIHETKPTTTKHSNDSTNVGGQCKQDSGASSQVSKRRSNWVVIKNIDPNPIERSEIQALIGGASIACYHPLIDENQVFIKLKNSSDAVNAASSLNQQRILGNIIHACVVDSNSIHSTALGQMPQKGHPSSSYKVNRPKQGSAQPSDPPKIFPVKVTQVSSGVTKKMLRDHFSQAGELAGEPKIHTSKNRSVHAAHVNFKSSSGAQIAVDKLHRSILDGRRINVSHEKPRMRSVTKDSCRVKITKPPQNRVCPLKPHSQADMSNLSQQESTQYSATSQHESVLPPLSLLPQEFTIPLNHTSPTQGPTLSPAPNSQQDFMLQTVASPQRDLLLSSSSASSFSSQQEPTLSSHPWSSLTQELSSSQEESMSHQPTQGDPLLSPQPDLTFPTPKLVAVAPLEQENVLGVYTSDISAIPSQVDNILHSSNLQSSVSSQTESTSVTQPSVDQNTSALHRDGVSQLNKVVLVQPHCVLQNQETPSLCEKQLTLAEEMGSASSLSEVVKESISSSVDLKEEEGGIGDVRSTTASNKSSLKASQMKQTEVVFKTKCRTNLTDFENHINHHLKHSIPFDVVQIISLESGGSEVRVLFNSLSGAKHVLKSLKGDLDGEIIKTNPRFGRLKKTLSEFKQSIQSKRECCVADHEKRLSDLKYKHEKMVLPKKCTLEQHQQITAQRKVLNQAIVERQSQLIEFTSYCEQLLIKLKELDLSGTIEEGDLKAIVSKMRVNFGIECNRFTRALPIYAYRSEIVKVVCENQVSVLIGETGSGKSTQLVQYLHGAGFSDQGVIVCTQPRKVAAISLANHVCTEMGESVVGKLLGFKAGNRGKFCDDTKVIYMTDHTLLNECISDPSLSKYSCLMIDEAHERSLNTDILLAFIKKCLSHRPDLRVIITSATIDPDLFVKYFGGGCPVVRVPGRTYPVDVVWNPLGITEPPIKRQYLSDAVEIVCRLHKSEPPGDILVFLTSPIEIEKACQKTSERLGTEAIVLPLHGKLQPGDQKRVFEEFEQRKIIFSTNVAETSVTIPGVKYVVDTGLAKELCFDPKKNMNSLEVRTISKSSAEQRKGRAGRTSAGQCFRLYREEDYQSMPSKMLPEILRVALASTALKLYEFGISDVLSFNFVEQPDPTALKAAMENLVFLGAVVENHLTELGRKMAALPIDPHLSKVLLDGIDEDIGAEATVAVAISTLAGSVFFRAGSDEMKNESDMKTITFCHPAGDQMTYLHTYLQWASQDRNSQTKWCVDNYVNAKSMKLVKECFNEIRDILARQFQIMISQNIENLEKAEEKLPKLYFNAFLRNLCVYLGHESVGYLNERLPDEQLVIFPGSPLRHLNIVPQLLVYEKTLKTSQHFLLQALPVKEEWVQEAIASGRLSMHPCYSSNYQRLHVSPLIINNLGKHILMKLQQNQRDIHSLLEADDIKPIIEFLRKEGMIKVFLQVHNHSPVSMLLRALIDSIRDELDKEIYECGITRDDDDVRLMMGSGGQIVQLLMPHEYRKVVVSGPRIKEWQESILKELQQHGSIKEHNAVENKKVCHLFVTFKDPDDAVKAVDSLVLPEGLRIEPQLFHKQYGEGGTNFSVRVEWCRRARKNCAFVTFHQSEDFVIASLRLSHHNIMVGRVAIKFRPSRDKENQLFIPNAGSALTAEEIKQVLLTYLQRYGVNDFDVSLGYEKSFTTTRQQYAAIKQELEEHVTKCATKGKFKVNLSQPENSHRIYTAYINFYNLAEGQKAVDLLRRVTLDGKFLTVSASLSSVVRYSPEVYEVIKEVVAKIKEEIHERYSSVKITHDKTDKRGNSLIRISSDHPKTFIIAKYALNSVINPDEIQCRNPTLREFIHTRNCKNSLQRIETETRTLIRVDYRTMTIKMYGTEANRTRAKIEFNKSLSFLDDGTKCHEIQLKKQGMPPGLMKHLVSEFGRGCQKLEERDGIQTVRLDPRRQILTLFATFDAHEQVVDVIKDFAKRLNPNLCAVPHNPDEVECCVCFSSITNVSDVIRLESCGHTYCCECIETQVAPSTVSIPVLCAADDCSKPLVQKDFHNFSLRFGFNRQHLAKMSVRTYVAANQDKVHVCPTPDCEMVYNVTEDGRCFSCSHCCVNTCTKCHEPYHDGLSCEMYQRGKEDDERLEEWIRRDPNNRKRCPHCSTPIEKTYGCNHVICESCRRHICWFCLKHFGSSGECYGHMGAVHRSWGLGVF